MAQGSQTAALPAGDATQPPGSEPKTIANKPSAETAFTSANAAEMAHVTKDIASASRPIMDDGSNGLLGGLLAKAILFTNRAGEVLSAHCEVDRLQPWVEAIRHRPIQALPAEWQALVKEALSSGRPICNREIVLTIPPRPSEAFHAAVSPARRADGTLDGLTVAIYDVAPIQELGVNLSQLVRLAGIGMLSADLAHEMKNAMVAVSTFVDILVHKHKDTELAPIVARELKRIDHLVGQLLRVSKPKPAEFRPVHLHELIDHAMAVTQHRLAGNRIRLERQLAADPDLVPGDASQLEQALINLLFNAVESMGSQGTLTVSSTLIHDPTGVPRVRLAVADTGCGIPPEVLHRVFDPFFTTKSTGHGLGLVITKRIVVDHGGTIEVDSETGKGTTFTIELPSAARQP